MCITRLQMTLKSRITHNSDDDLTLGVVVGFVGSVHLMTAAWTLCHYLIYYT